MSIVRKDDLYNLEGDYILTVCPNPSVDIYAWIDEFTIKGVNRISGEERYPGGKGVHVALAASEMGEEVRLLGFWGGPSGQWITEACEKRYSNLKCIGPRLTEWTRSCYTFKSEKEVDDTELLGVGPNLKKKDIETFYAEFAQFVENAKCVTISGSWPLGAPADACKQLLERSRRFRKAVFLDCTGEQFENAVQSAPYLVHLNRRELMGLYGGLDIMQAARRLTEECNYAAITDGANGLFLAREKNTIHANCTIDEVYSAVGSGDCLMAGLAVAFIRGCDEIFSARLGVACGAANCLNEELGMLKNEDVEKLVQKARAEIIKTIPDLS